MKKPFSPHELTPVLQALSQTDGVIIGGQAVNLWAEHYQTESPPWADLRPYTSFDLDVLGSRTDLLKCSQTLNAEVFFPDPSENTVNSGKIVTQINGSELEIDFLHSPNGLSPAEVTELARRILFERDIAQNPASSPLPGKQEGKPHHASAKFGGPPGPEASAPLDRHPAPASLKIDHRSWIRTVAPALGSPNSDELEP